MEGKIHSYFAGGTVDGPGIRYVIFLKGCPLRCLYCHNPDTWTAENAILDDSKDIVAKALRYKGYFANGGGVTVTGGEPLMQMDFLIELFTELKRYKIHTTIDTSGAVFNSKNEQFMQKMTKLLSLTDLFLLDIKHIDNEIHKKLTGKENTNILEFARYLSDNNKKMWIRHVLVKGYTLDDEYLKKTREFIDSLKTVEKIEVLPYHSMGEVKYQNLGIDYPLKGLDSPSKEEVRHAKILLGVIKDEAK